MPTAVAVTGADMALPAQDERTLPAVVLRDVDTRPLDQVLAELQLTVEQYGHVVVVCSKATPTAVLRRLHTLRSLMESDRIALFRPDLPPLAVAVLARQLRQLASCDIGPGVLASAGRLLTHYLHAGALLGSVARLDRVPVDLKQHAKSWMPGSQFAVLAHPQPHLVRLGPDTTLDGPEFGTWMLVARGQLQSDWVTTTLAPAWRVQGLRERRCPRSRATGGAPASSSSSAPTCPTCPCSTNWSRPCGAAPVTGAASTSSATAACSVRPPRPPPRPDRPSPGAPDPYAHRPSPPDPARPLSPTRLHGS